MIRFGWLLIGLLVLVPIVRLGFYAGYGLDLGTVIIAESSQGVHFLFSGLEDSVEQRDKLIAKLEGPILRLDGESPTNSITSDGSILPYYLETSHPCNSFYDSVCGIHDSLGTSNTDEDIAIISRVSAKRSSGMFYEVTKFSQTLFMSIVEKSKYYQACISLGNVGWLQWENIQTPDIVLPSLSRRSNTTAMGLLMLSGMVKGGLQLPISIKIEKLLHKPTFGVVFGFNMLPLLDITFHEERFDNPMDIGGTSLLFGFYADAMALNNNVGGEPDTIGDYISRCRGINSTKPITRELLAMIYPNSTKIDDICSFESLDVIVSLLVQFLGQDPVTYWAYFHRLTAYYETLPLIKNSGSLLYQRMVPINKMSQKDWLMTLFQGVKEGDRNTRTVEFGRRKLIERFSHHRWSSSLAEDLKHTVTHHVGTHQMSFTVSSSNVRSIEEPMTQPQMCTKLTGLADRLWLNLEYARVNEIGYYGKNNTRTNGVELLVKRTLKTTYQLLDESTYDNQQTKVGLLKKMDNLVIRVKGLPNMPNVTPTGWGIDTDSWEISRTNDGKKTLYYGLYRYFMNRARLDNVKLSANNYLHYRTESSLFFWEDLEVPYEIVNAWYDPLENTITIPIGITHMPMFRNVNELDDAIVVPIIGHEMGHSIENNGRLFDEFGSYVFNGTIHDETDDGLWIGGDLTRINASIACLAEDYGHPCGTAAYGYHTMTEDIADQMGVRTGMKLLLDTIYTNYQQQYGFNMSRTTILREYFENHARLWCGRSSIESQCELTKKDPHALAKHRVNKTFKQIKEFAEAFNCQKNSNMYKEPKDMCLIYM